MFLFSAGLAEWIHEGGILFELDSRGDWTEDIGLKMGHILIFVGNPD